MTDWVDGTDADDVERGGLLPSLGQLVNMVGSFASVAIVAGVGYWGYQTVMRDVSGVPVIKALAGPVRVAPEEAGGVIATHAGLSVNEVAEEGAGSAPVDRLALAPRDVALTSEDVSGLGASPMVARGDELTPTRVAAPGAVAPTRSETIADAVAQVAEELRADAAEEPRASTLDLTSGAPGTTLSTDDLLALADEIAGEIQPLAPLAEAPVPGSSSVRVPTDSATPVGARVPQTVPGVVYSLRPQLRPSGLVVPAVAAVPSSASSDDRVIGAVAEAIGEATPVQASLPVGTQLVQLGAFGSEAIAASEWDRVSGAYGDYLRDRAPVIQRAVTNGKTFYRLRVRGFDSSDEANRLCAALSADGQACIPVVIR